MKRVLLLITIIAFGCFGAVKTDTLKAKGIRLGSGDLLSVYDTGSFACTLKTSDVTVQQIGRAYWTKTGNVFTCSFPYIGGTSNSTNFRIYCALPFLPKQEYGGYKVNKSYASMLDDSAIVDGGLIISEEYPYVAPVLVSGSFTASGTKGLFPCTVEFITED